MEANSAAQHSASPTYSSHERSGQHHGILSKLGDAVHKVAVNIEDADTRDSPHFMAARKRLDHQRAEELADGALRAGRVRFDDEHALAVD